MKTAEERKALEALNALFAPNAKKAETHVLKMGGQVRTFTVEYKTGSAK